MTDIPDDAVPFTFGDVQRSLQLVLDNCRAGGKHSAEDVLTLALAMLENTSCPHAECPRLLIDHPPWESDSGT